MALVGALTVVLGSALGLELDSAALLGVALGGVVGLVPDGSPVLRACAFVLGLGFAWAGFVVRAAVLPDAAVGRAIVVALVVGLCAVAATATVGRLPLWALLAGAAAMAGSYEATYALAPSRVLETSPSGATTVLLTAALGFLAASLAAAATTSQRDGAHVAAPADDTTYEKTGV